MSAEHEVAARDLYARLLGAWNERDASGFAELFTEDGVSIGFDGSEVTGEEIRDHLDSIFTDHPTAAYVAKMREVRPLGPNAALLRAIVGMVPPGGDNLNPAANALQSLVIVRRGERWRITLLQNTPAQYHGRPDLVDSHTAEIEQVRAAGAALA